VCLKTDGKLTIQSITRSGTKMKLQKAEERRKSDELDNKKLELQCVKN